MTNSKNINFKERDKLERNNEAEYLVNYLTRRYELKKDEEDSFVLNVNAKWGYGKTFFLNLIKEELESKDYEVVYFNSWENDFTKEPLLAFFSEINSSLEKYLDTFNKENRPFFKNILKSSLPILISVLTKHLTGLTSEQFEELLKEEEINEKETETEIQKDVKTTLSSIMSKTTELALKEHNTIKKSIKEFEENMKTLLDLIKKEEKNLPLFILIDELDRCRPNYAIELLENIKHIFNIPGIYFIIATNSKQLSHSINAIYGANFSSQKYLKRFFHQEYNLKEPNEYEFIKFLFEKENINMEKFFNPLPEDKDKDMNIILIKSFSELFLLTLRDIEQCVNILLTISITWEKKEKIHLVPLLFYIMLRSRSTEEFEKNEDYAISNLKINELKDSNILKSNTKKLNIDFSKQLINIEELIEFYSKIKNEKNRDIFIKRDVGDSVVYENIANEFFEHMPKITTYYNLVKYSAQLK